MRKQMKRAGLSCLLAGTLLFGMPGAQVTGYAVSSYDGGEDEEPEDEEETDGNSIAECHFTIGQSGYAYTGRAIEPMVTVTGKDADSGAEVTLTKDEDYTVSYEDNVDYGVGRVIVQGIGDYTGYHIEKFGILPGKVSGLKVKSPFYLENTVTWNKVKGADGYYIYRKAPGGDFQYICNVTDENYQVFHDNVGLKSGKTYSYRIAAYVEDPYPDEEVDVEEGIYDPFSKGSAEYDDEEDYVFSGGPLFYYSLENEANYYGANATEYVYAPYSYSCAKGKCTVAFEAELSAAASGKVTKKVTGTRYTIYTGDALADYMVYLTDKKIIKSSMGTDKRVKKIYDWMVKNCNFTKDVKNESKLKKMKKYFPYDTAAFQEKAAAYEKKVMQKIYTGKALCMGSTWHDCDRGRVALAYRKGSCSYLTPMFNMLCGGAGVEAHIIDGYYVNKDKSKDYHNWSFVKIGKKYYWYDVPVACKNKKNKKLWYKKGTKYWKTCHSWKASATKSFQAAKFAK